MIVRLANFVTQRSLTLADRQLPIYSRPMWSVDQFHPSERGHRLIANALADLLEEDGLRLPERPTLEPSNPPPTRGASARWLATRGVKWVLDRAFDLGSALAAMALTEWISEATGALDRFEAELRGEVALAIAEFGRPVHQNIHAARP